MEEREREKTLKKKKKGKRRGAEDGHPRPAAFFVQVCAVAARPGRDSLGHVLDVLDVLVKPVVGKKGHNNKKRRKWEKKKSCPALMRGKSGQIGWARRYHQMTNKCQQLGKFKVEKRVIDYRYHIRVTCILVSFLCTCKSYLCTVHVWVLKYIHTDNDRTLISLYVRVGAALLPCCLAAFLPFYFVAG